MSGLVEFLLARTTDDEACYDAIVKRHKNRDWTVGDGGSSVLADGVDPVFYTYEPDEPACAFVVRFEPIRVRRDCEAKRRMIEHAAVSLERGCSACGNSSLGSLVEHADDCGGDGELNLAETVLIAIAQPYVDHPEFRDEWRYRHVAA